MVKRKRTSYFFTKSYCRFRILIVIIFADCVLANWWLLGLPGQPSASQGAGAALGQKENCDKLLYLNDKQRGLCSLGDGVLHTIGVGAKYAIEECQHQFRMSRWNCTAYHNSSSVFGGIISVKSRESAFVHAITSAGVAYTITRACSKGELNECSCDNKPRSRKGKNKGWKWGGCSEDIEYGEKFSREFVDSAEDTHTSIGLMNQHNNEAGRRIIRSKMERVCKCHGMSGSCNSRVCWRRLPEFRNIGDALSARYEGAVLVKMVDKKKKRVKKLRAAGKDIKQPNRTELVYLEESPDYCERNDTLGVLGTKGRLCNQGSLGLDGCSLLCCGRGYQTRIRDVEEKCKCRFVWCCNVVCELCKEKREEFICN